MRLAHLAAWKNGIMERKIRIGIAGLGVVGAHLARMIMQPTDELHDNFAGGIFAARAGEFDLSGICARDRTKDRGIDTSAIDWFDDPVDLAKSENIDVFVELIGGQEGPAADAVRAALEAGKHVVTANKALLAIHGRDLAMLAEANGVSIGYEAAVAGAVPIISTLKTMMAPCKIDRVVGILNGTCNYILSEMESTGAGFSAALGDAQAKGFAEADPALDIEGDDAAHKLALITSIAFGIWPDGMFAKHANSDARLFVQGIDHLGARDIEYTQRLGFRIRLLGVAENHKTTPGAPPSLTVEPFLVPVHHPLANATGPGNHITIEGAPIGKVSLAGPGAGGGPTASAVASDLLSLLNRQTGPVFGRPASDIAPVTLVQQSSQTARFYLRIAGVSDAGRVHETINMLTGTDKPSDAVENVAYEGEWAGLTGEISLKTLQKAREAFEESGCSVTTIRIAEF